MTRSWRWQVTALAVLWMLTPNIAAAQLMSTCAPDSPERRGGIGCSIIESKPLPEGLTALVFWHIDRFDSLDAARAAVGPASIAFESGGTSWLMTIESETSNHHGGRHVTHVGPLPLPKATKYAMVAQSAVFMPGMYSLVHHHSGVEAVYVVEGEACFETPTRAAKLHKGETLALPGDTPMRAVVTGTGRSSTIPANLPPCEWTTGPDRGSSRASSSTLYLAHATAGVCAFGFSAIGMRPSGHTGTLNLSETCLQISDGVW